MNDRQRRTGSSDLAKNARATRHKNVTLRAIHRIQRVTSFQTVCSCQIEAKKSTNATCGHICVVTGSTSRRVRTHQAPWHESLPQKASASAAGAIHLQKVLPGVVRPPLNLGSWPCCGRSPPSPQTPSLRLQRRQADGPRLPPPCRPSLREPIFHCVPACNGTSGAVGNEIGSPPQRGPLLLSVPRKPCEHFQEGLRRKVEMTSYMGFRPSYHVRSHIGFGRGAAPF